MTNLLEINSREDFKYVVAGKVIDGENTYETRVFEANDKPLHDLIGDEKENWGIKPNPSGHSGKFRQIACAEAQMELGLDVDYYNGAAIDGKSYKKAYEKENDYNEEEMMAWMFAKFIMYQNGFDITKSGNSRDDETFRFIDGSIQKWNKLRNKYRDDTSYFDFITGQIVGVFQPLNKMLDNSIMNVPDDYKVKLRANVEHHNLFGNRCIIKSLFEQLKNESSELNFNNLESGSTIMIGNKFALTIIQNFDGTYDLVNVFNWKTVKNYPSLAYITTLVLGLISGLKKTLYSEFSPQIFVIPSKHFFIF